MSGEFTNDSIIEMFIYETTELISQLENIALDSESSNALESQINEVFRIVHTIKGTAAMMEYNNISSVAHSLEDVFYYIRENHPEKVDFSGLTDIVLICIDYIKNAIEVVQADPTGANNNGQPDEQGEKIVTKIKAFLVILKGETAVDESEVQAKTSEKSGEASNNVNSNTNDTKEAFGENEYKALLYFEDGCEMENVRAFNVINNLENIADIIKTIPAEVPGDANAITEIRQNGFTIHFRTDLGFEDLKAHLSNTLFLKEFYVEPVAQDSKKEELKENVKAAEKDKAEVVAKPAESVLKTAPPSMASVKQSIISVNLDKLDRLMDMVGELVISQEMVIQNSDLQGMVLNDFQKAARQLRKVTNEIQDAVMSIRMIPIAATFQKMHRIIRDMSKKLDKEVKFEIIGETTEVDKNVIEHLTDPLMHIIRNSMDHGIESTEERIAAGKPPVGTVTLEAKDDGGDVCIIVRDDGKGLDRDKILKKAKEQGIIKADQNTLTDREIYSLIFLPGFSTKKQVTEFSGRGVGMDVVNNNMEKINGKALVDSTQGVGTTITLKIPLTLAIIEGMKVKVGDSIFVIPITSIKESFRVNETSIVLDDFNNSEMIMLRGDCLPILRLHQYYDLKPQTTTLSEGIIVVVENDSKEMCLFADKVIGQQQVVVKPLPKYIKNVKGVCGCTVMGDGSVCLISDITDMFKN
ncbi:MAG: chemotaxis protein CheA [Oscillospiraceae bacterium]